MAEQMSVQIENNWSNKTKLIGLVPLLLKFSSFWFRPLVSFLGMRNFGSKPNRTEIDQKAKKIKIELSSYVLWGY